MHTSEIKHHLDTCAITALTGTAARGIHTLPDGMAATVAEVQDLADEHADRYGHIADRRAARAIQDRLDQLGGATAYGNATTLITEHLQPALARFLASVRADLTTAGRYVDHTGPASDLLSEAEDVRQAYLRLVDGYATYADLRSGWALLRGRESLTTIDPQGVNSPLAEVANLPDLFDGWQMAAAGRAAWPWHSTAFHVRMHWLLSHGARVWLPTGAEQSTVWQQYHPEARVHAA